MRSELVFALLFAATSCSDDKNGSPAQPPKGQPTIVLVPGDGGVSSSAITTGTGVDPSSVHLDDHSGHRPITPQPLPGRERRAIDVTLRSSPPGAQVNVDGTVIGVTPAFWSGYADGREHQFVFTLPGHAIARYRFVPVSSGVIHARLDPIAIERDAGVAQPTGAMPHPPEVMPHPTPSAVVPPAAPPTIVSPDAAMPTAPPPAVTPPAMPAPDALAPAPTPTPTPTPIGPQQ